ncbi:signal peptidase I [Acetivibrio clariflavus]|uniref:Signal peptidase I n=1 Tax=Acetivibrio clariflavus (strain DSM 19732 / NBRC 101661 / EBR45) TaxID=720554 RepID=G8LV57_ACECE|nr:signal peptidase I [Acetivibrio clariflavus]AEV69634.1 signal peptidase I [Acetivibrio clariflavus DSM 19732]
MENNGSIGNENKSNVKKEIISWIKYILSALIISFLLTKFVILNAYIPTGSMEDTIMPGDRVFASRIHYFFTEPKRGDIIVFKYPDDESINYVKRVIGLPGEKVEIRNGEVYINDVKLDEPYIKEEMSKEDLGPYQVPEDSYFVMGDNRNNSNDSRRWLTTNYVHKSKILGKVAFQYFPKFKWLW